MIKIHIASKIFLKDILIYLHFHLQEEVVESFVTNKKRWDVVEQHSEDGGSTEERIGARHLSTVAVAEIKIISRQEMNAKDNVYDDKILVSYFS